MDSGGTVERLEGMMNLNETQYTQFQVRPSKSPDREDGRCVFKNDAFDLDDVYHISAVDTYTGINCFYFTVHTHYKQLTYHSPTKSEALRWQRELYRAWTCTGEFEYDKKECT